MATWKKVVVSGSNVSQLNNDANYLTAGTLIVPNGFSTASFDGTALISNSLTGSLNFASSSGQGLTISADAGTDTLTFGLASIPNASLRYSGSILGSTVVTLGETVTSIAGLTLTGVVASGSFTGSFVGDGSGLTGVVSNLAISGSTGNGSVALKTQALSILGTANEVETSVSGQTVTVGLPNDVTIGNNLTVTGNLFVNGTTTQINTTELLVEDKFILLASGSANAGDGGIIIDRGSDVLGNIAFGYSNVADRWGYQNGLTDTTTGITIGTDGNSAFAGYVFTEATHTTAPTTGEFVLAGAIYTATSGDIFIYS
jgi:hypothetical protein